MRFCAVRGGGSAVVLPRHMGVDNVREVGTPTVFHSGNSNSRPITNACSPNEDSVIQLRRLRSAHEVSSMLSANMVCSNIVSSSVKSVCWYGHHEHCRGRCRQKKKAAFSRGLLELSRHQRCPLLLFWRLTRLGRAASQLPCRLGASERPALRFPSLLARARPTARCTRRPRPW